MIVSDTPPFVWLLPWKCGSTTVKRRLVELDTKRAPSFRHFNQIIGAHVDKHIPLDQAAQLPDASPKLQRATLVRNPYDRMYSGFMQRKKRLAKNPPEYLSAKEIRAELFVLNQGFLAFLQHLSDLHEAGLPMPAGHPLYRHMLIEGTPAVDYVGFLETFEASFAQICAKLGAKPANEMIANVQFEGALISPHAFTQTTYRYLNKYTPEGLEIVNRLFSEDFERLPYRLLHGKDLPRDQGSPSDPLCPFSLDDPLLPQSGNVLSFDWRSAA
ncbi:Sulfotransferase family protein [Shimia sp. SK013]|uniref:sulfotransferase family 2 domain-containing protein n=1 Tax=Shimia sp. SK013 TaxID=1389006 RepID=UPI0006B429B4|nr:sulfotransferase family 2 domain-containing protein [Shimia sp. SK013]KPA20919.1 Sulfotransferase family protein [Shimia sp. SK013]